MSTAALVVFYGGKSLTDHADMDTALTEATNHLGEAAVYWGTQFDAAVACLAAHQLLLNPGGDCGVSDGLTRGQVTSEGSSENKVTYAALPAASLGDAELVRTTPGASFLRMRSARPTVGFAVLT
jgi:hypothetical protein